MISFFFSISLFDVHKALCIHFSVKLKHEEIKNFVSFPFRPPAVHHRYRTENDNGMNWKTVNNSVFLEAIL